MLTDLLLMSEIKGYVRRPSWYFESDDTLHRRALDELLMVPLVPMEWQPMHL